MGIVYTCVPFATFLFNKAHDIIECVTRRFYKIYRRFLNDLDVYARLNGHSSKHNNFGFITVEIQHDLDWMSTHVVTTTDDYLNSMTVCNNGIRFSLYFDGIRNDEIN